MCLARHPIIITKCSKNQNIFVLDLIFVGVGVLMMALKTFQVEQKR